MPIYNPTITESIITYAYKATDETVNNSSTVQNDDDLVLAVEANQVYVIELSLHVSTGGTPDFKYCFAATATSTGHRQGNASSASAANGKLLMGKADLTTELAHLVSADPEFLNIVGVIIVGATAGTLQLKWAQNTADVSDTKVKAGSWMKLTKVS